MLGRLQPRLRQLSAADVAALERQLEQRAAAVWCGQEAAADELASLAALAADQGGLEGNQQQGQQEAQQQQQREQQREQEERQLADASAAQAVPEAEAPAQQPTQKTKKKKKDVFHSKESRNAALLQRANEQAGAKGSGAGPAAAATKAAATPGAQLAGWLADALHSLLSTPPTKLPGASLA